MTGRLLAWAPDRALASCDVALGNLVEIEGGGEALVLALYRDHVELAPLTTRQPRVGAVVRDAGPCGPLQLRTPLIRREIGGTRLTLGTLALDLQRWFGVGTSFAMIGAAAMARELMHHHAALGKTCIVATANDSAAGARWLAPWRAMAEANEARARGEHAVVLVDLDDWRPVVEGFTLRGGWPTQLGQLSSLAYCGAHGSATLIALARAFTREIGDAFDVVIDLETVARGERRVVTKLVRPPLGVPSKRELARLCFDGERTRECFRFRRGGTTDSAEQLACAIAVGEREVPTPEIEDFIVAYLAMLRADHAERLAAIRRRGAFDDTDLRALRAAAATIRP